MALSRRNNWTLAGGEPAQEPVWRGWWPAGVERLFLNQDALGSAFLGFADGSALFFQRDGAGVFTAPLGEHSTLSSVSGVYKRVMPGGREIVWYSSTGLVDSVTDNNPPATRRPTPGQLEARTDLALIDFEWPSISRSGSTLAGQRELFHHAPGIANVLTSRKLAGASCITAYAAFLRKIPPDGGVFGLRLDFQLAFRLIAAMRTVC